MKDLLWEFRFIIILVLGALIYAVLEWGKVKVTLLGLMLKAKSLAKDAILKSGKEQEEWVIRNAYHYLPSSFKLFISKAMMQKLVHYIYHMAKDKLDDGCINDSVKE